MSKDTSKSSQDNDRSKSVYELNTNPNALLINKWFRDIETFIETFKAGADFIYKQLSNPYSVLKMLNFLSERLPEEIRKHVVFACTSGMINQIELDDGKDIITFHISPIGNEANLVIVDHIYNKLTASNIHPKIMFAKYLPYNFNNEIKESIEFEVGTDDINFNLSLNETNISSDQNKRTYKLNYKQLGFCSNIGLKSTPTGTRRVVNLIICVDKSIADVVLEKKTVVFENEKSREVWFPKEFNGKIPLMDMVVEVVGEYNLIHHVGYMEFLNSAELHNIKYADIIGRDSSDVPKNLDTTMNKVNFYEISDIRKDLDIVVKDYGYKQCTHCSVYDIQMKLFECEKCKTKNVTYYCSNLCQRLHYPIHKVRCIQNDASNCQGGGINHYGNMFGGTMR